MAKRQVVKWPQKPLFIPSNATIVECTEDVIATAMRRESKDSPAVQRTFANSRDGRFRLASHGGGDYIQEQTVMDGESNMPGAVVYEREGSRITRKNAAIFGPGDLYCSIWNLLGMAGLGEAEWTPQYKYWSRPQIMDDGGANLVD